MKICKALQLDVNKRSLISFVGGGGKTTTIFELADELIKANKKVLISTTTKVFNPEKGQYDHYFLQDIDEDFTPLGATITILGKSVIDGKLEGLSPENIDQILDRKIFDFILIEADGSKRKPIKAPAFHEPIIPRRTTLTLGIIGLDCLNKPMDGNTVHRPELLKKLPGNEKIKIINEDVIVNLVLAKDGIFKGSKGKELLLLNKVDEEIRIERARMIGDRLKSKGFTNIIIGDIKKKVFY